MKLPLHRVLGAALFTGMTLTWTPFSSATYPYTISRPSSFTYVVLTDPAGHRVDYFFPSLGSFTTNVNIYAEPGSVLRDGGTYLRAIGGRNIRRVGWITLTGMRLPLIRANFKGLAGNWTVEEVSLHSPGLIWHLTASYDHKYRRLRSTMLRMLRSFRLRAGI